MNILKITGLLTLLLSAAALNGMESKELPPLRTIMQNKNQSIYLSDKEVFVFLYENGKTTFFVISKKELPPLLKDKK